MFRYICKRIAFGVIALFVLVTAAFFLTRMMPGSPFQNGNIPETVFQAMEEEYGLNEPVLKQYAIYAANLLKGDLGVSYKKPGVTVQEIISRAWPATASVGLPAVLLAVLLGTLLGIWQASTEKKGIKAGIFLGTMLGTGIPNFVICLLLSLFFGVKLKLLPITGLLSMKHYILPVISLAVYPAAVITRMMYQSFREEMNRDYVVLARAKGLAWPRIAFTHILKNAWIPVLGYIGPASAFLLTGSFAVESIFNIPGLGREFVNSIANRDYTLILGLTVFMGAVVIGIHLLTDILGALLSPEIRRAYR